MSTVSSDQARAILVSLFPPGQLYDFNNSEADIYKLMASCADAWKMYGFDVIDTLRTEFQANTCVQKLEDWETALGIVEGVNANLQGRTTAERQAAVLSKLRESGASTLANIRAAVGPLLGYANPGNLQVVECNRAALTTAHTYTYSALPVTVNSGFSTDLVIPVSIESDGGVVSPAGLRLTFDPTTLNAYTGISIRITGPTGAQKTWSGSDLAPQGQGTTFTASSPIRLYTSAFNGLAINGDYTIRLSNTSGINFTIDDLSIFVEGVGIGLETGAAVFDWGVYSDVTWFNNPDYVGALATIGHIQPAHTVGRVILSLGPLSYPDLSTSLPDAMLPA